MNKTAINSTIGIVVTAAFFAYAYYMSNKMENRRITEKLCQRWANNIIDDAKTDTPEQGKFKADLEVKDLWDTPLKSDLKVTEKKSTVTVYSAGPDQQFDTGDDIFAVQSDGDILLSLETGSKSIGKGLAKGVIEGVSEVGKKGVEKAKNKAKKLKDNLMAKFKKQDD